MTCPVCSRAFDPKPNQVYCGEVCRKRAEGRRRRGAPISDPPLRLVRSSSDVALEVTYDARCICGDPLVEVPNPPTLTDSWAKATRSGWCDSCRRGFVVVVTRRPMRRHEEEPVVRARHTLEVTR